VDLPGFFIDRIGATTYRDSCDLPDGTDPTGFCRPALQYDRHREIFRQLIPKVRACSLRLFLLAIWLFWFLQLRILFSPAKPVQCNMCTIADDTLKKPETVDLKIMTKSHVAEYEAKCPTIG
jgi:hypothetical protein